jgi:transposase
MQGYIGIDWSEDKHDVVFMNQAGVDVARLTISHSLDGFVQLEAARRKLGLMPEECTLGLETAHNLIIEYLWSQAYQKVYVIPPSVVKSNRNRFRQSGARDDQSDGYLLADILRTDRGRLQPWHPDSLLTRQMRAKVSWIHHLTRASTRLSNRLRAVLLRYYPAALQAFPDLSTQIALEFIRAYPTPEAAASLSWAELEDFAHQQAYSHPKKLPGCFTRLHGDYPQTSPETVLVYQDEAVQLASLLLQTSQTKRTALRELQALYRQHPDYPIFSSLPGAGEFLGPGLLAKFGDDRQRFPTPASVQALAGTCPVTDKSGKRKVIKFRKACDREWRSLSQAWAIALVNRAKSPVAIAYFEQVRTRCHNRHHAYRCVANRWLAIAWKLWQSSQSYDQAYHFQQRAARSKPKSR